MIAVALLAGVLAGALGLLLFRTVLEQGAFRRTNRRGLDVATAAGLVLVVGTVAVEATVIVVDRAGASLAAVTGPGRLATIVAVLGFGLTGLVDDLAGDRTAGGFAGHLRSLRAGRPDTGALKVVLGGLVSLLAAAVLTTGLADLVVATVVIALAANLGNLFDLVPGRAVKVAVLGLVPLVLVTWPADELWGPVVVLGVALAVLVPELREQVMLGDTGSNVLGAAGGVGAVVALGENGRVAAVLVLMALNLVSERVSFSRVIERTPPLRFLDGLGRRP